VLSSRKVFLFGFFLIFVSQAITDVQPATEKEQIRNIWFHQVPAVSKAPVIDGKIDDDCWRELPALTNFGRDRYSLKSTHPLIPMSLKLGYDKVYLYCLWKIANPAGEFRVDYEALRKKQQEAMYDSAMFWNQPSLEFRIDGRRDRLGETMIQMNLVGQKEAFQKIATGWSTEYTEGWDIWADYSYVAGFNESGWWVEMKVALRDLNVEPRPGYIMGAQFRYFHKPGVYFAWTPAGYDTSGYGDLLLVEKPLPMEKALELICPEYRDLVVRMPQPEKVVVVEKGRISEMGYRQTLYQDWEKITERKQQLERLLINCPLLQKEKILETIKKSWESLDKEIGGLMEVGAAEIMRLKQPMEELSWYLEQLKAMMQIHNLLTEHRKQP